MTIALASTVHEPSPCTGAVRLCVPNVIAMVAGSATLLVPEMVGVVSVVNAVAPPVMVTTGGFE